MKLNFKCPCCGAHGLWEYIDDFDNGDWVEEIYACQSCGHRIYLELPD